MYILIIHICLLLFIYFYLFLTYIHIYFSGVYISSPQLLQYFLDQSCRAHVKRDLLQCQKRPTTESKETYYTVKRDLLHSQNTFLRSLQGGRLGCTLS
jgi:hypothetical protein